MKKILFVESYPHALVGQQRTLLAMLEGCKDVAMEPVVAVTGEGSFTEQVRSRDIELIMFPYPDSIAGYGGAIYRTKGLRWLRMMGQVFSYVLSIRSQLRELNVKAVFCNDMRGLLTVGIAALLSGIPIMIWDKLDKPHGWMDWVQLPLVKRNVIISDAVRVKYPYWQQAFYQDRIVKVHDGADLLHFDAAKPIRAKLPGDKGDILIGIVGTITERKGQDRVLRIWKDVLAVAPSARLLIVGETSGSEEDSDYVESLQAQGLERVHWLGMRNDVPNIMKSIDLLIVPSRHEGMGLVTVEAMACSLPVVGANSGGIPEVVVHGQTGLIVDGESPHELRDAITRLATTPDLRKTFGQAGRLRAEKSFNRPVLMKAVLEMLREMA